MTWSIIARDTYGEFGVAIASKFFAVGAWCPHVRSYIGALSTQALVNPLYAAPVMEGLAQGHEPELIVKQVTDADAGRDHRQLHLIDARGISAAYTGSACIDWCGHTAGPGYSVAGNMLAGPQVIAATAAVYVASSALPFSERLIAALAAGEAAGGDKRGKQAAALLIYSTEDYCALDLRVDDHPEPIQELQRLHRKSLERFQPFRGCLPSRSNPAGVTDRDLIEAEIERFQAERLGPA
jgi:uncharacterized Ntn-hydrolase superfamily protein